MDANAATPLEADVTVVGAGAAGLFCALTAAGTGARVALVSSSPLRGSASYWAQGGIAAALAPEDSPALHREDTLTAGRGAARGSAVGVLAEDSPKRVRELQDLGVEFDSDDDGSLALGLEGGHSARRIVHAGGSATGRRITEHLAAIVAAHERIQILEQTTAIGLLVLDDRCLGARVRNGDGERTLSSRATVLATGGGAALWSRTTNPPESVGVGLALAHAAGADLADLDLTQFHPTALVSDSGGDGFLITEAVRGEGALLLDGSGRRFVDELAPRDEVALAIEATLEAEGARSVHLDMRAIDMARFPNILEALAGEGLDPARDTVPVAPAAHYTMGGIATDLDGRASLQGLYAVGECACTGLHGANRLASNSLAECFVFSRRAGLTAVDEPSSTAAAGATSYELPARPTQETRESLWRLAGLRRTAEGLATLREDPYPVARLIAAACLAREESRGAHQRSDRPQTDPDLDEMHTVVAPTGAARLERWT